MPIVSSIVEVGHAQRDGRRYAIERHTDHLGTAHLFEYLAAIDADHNAIMLARVPKIEAHLAAVEYHMHVSTDGWTPLEHQTGSEFAARLRGEYRDSTRERVCYLAWWLIRRINSGDLTDAAVRNAFGMTVQQYSAFKTRATAMHDHWQAVLDAVGE